MIFVLAGGLIWRIQPVLVEQFDKKAANDRVVISCGPSRTDRNKSHMACGFPGSHFRAWMALHGQHQESAALLTPTSTLTSFFFLERRGGKTKVLYIPPIREDPSQLCGFAATSHMLHFSWELWPKNGASLSGNALGLLPTCVYPSRCLSNSS